MKRLYGVFDNLTLDDIKEAARRAFESHDGESVVIQFAKKFDENCLALYMALRDGTYVDLIGYRKMKKKNSNGKLRDIDSPTLVTRIYEYVFINVMEPHYYSKDNWNGLNCKKGCGITSLNPSKSVIHRLKSVFYDRLDIKYALVIDQRQCYAHIRPSVFRKAMKNLVDDTKFIDFAIKVSFVNKKLPIGTPSSPLIHHIVMYEFDKWVKELSNVTVRYADNNFIGFRTLEEANTAKWRVKNYWWYKLQIRAKRHDTQIVPLSKPLDFCGYVLHRNDLAKNMHNKGYMTVRKSTVERAKKCKSDESWASYFGIMKHSDSYNLMVAIQDKMKLSDLTSKIKIDRGIDAENIAIDELIGQTFSIYDYDLRYKEEPKEKEKGKGRKSASPSASLVPSENKTPNWIKCLIGIPELDAEGKPTKRKKAFEFHGGYSSLCQFVDLCEKQYTKQDMLPIDDVEIENSCGYIFKGSTNKTEYINEDYRTNASPF